MKLNNEKEIFDLYVEKDADEELLPEILEAAERHGTEIIELTENTDRTYGDLRLQLIAPPDEGSENERCIISLVSVGEYDTIITGDSPQKAERRLLEELILPDAELLIVGHHGSRNASSPEFLSALRAEDAVISVGKNNSFGHPTREVLARLQSCGMEIYRTDMNGTVEVWVQAE